MHAGGSTQQAPMPWPHISPGATRWLQEAFGTLQSLPISQAQAVQHTCPEWLRHSRHCP